jgi:hypothetical protein
MPTSEGSLTGRSRARLISLGKAERESERKSCMGHNSLPFLWLGRAGDDERSRSAWDGTLGICCPCSLQAVFPNPRCIKFSSFACFS